MMVTVDGLQGACARLVKATGWSEQVAATQCGVSINTFRKWSKSTPHKAVRTNDAFLVTLTKVYQQHVGSDPAIRIFGQR